MPPLPRCACVALLAAAAARAHEASLAASSLVRVGFHTADVEEAGSTALLDIAFPAGDAPLVWQPMPVVPGGVGRNEWFTHDVMVSGTTRPTRVALRSSSEDGVAIDRIVVADGEVREGLPMWLDNPCLPPDQQTTPCASEFTWSVVYPPTTTATRTATRSSTTTTVTTTTESRTTTTTVTTTATSSSTTSSITSSSTGTSTTRTVTDTATGTTTSSITATTSSSTGTLTATRTTSTTGTTTVTSTSSATTTGTTTTTTSTIPLLIVERSMQRAMRRAAVPQAFYNEMEAVLTLRTNWSASREVTEIWSLEARVESIIADFVGLGVPPNAIICTLIRDSDLKARAVLRFRVSSRSERSIFQVRDVLKDDALRGRMNDLLGALGAEEGALVSVETSLTHCGVGALFCCVSVVVYDIVHNAGVLSSYKDMFLMAFVLGVIFLIVLCWDLHWLPVVTQARRLSAEEARGHLVVPLLLTGSVFQAVVMTLGCLHKYHMMRRACREPAEFPMELVQDCPPVLWWALSEVFVFGISNLIVFAIGYCAWRREWKADCESEDAALTDQAWRPVMPLESLLRRSHLLGFLEVRHTDHAARVDHLFLVVNDLAISFAVVLTSFFAMQQYSLPGVVVAWHPYKLMYELTLGFAARELFRKAAMRPCLGQRRLRFIIGGVVCFAAVDLWMWYLIMSTYARISHEWSFDKTVRLLDIAIGAGLVNYLLTQLHTSLMLRMLSVYVYEPYIRHSTKRCLYFFDPVEIPKLRAMLQASGGAWAIDGSPRRFGGIRNRAGAARHSKSQAAEAERPAAGSPSGEELGAASSEPSLASSGDSSDEACTPGDAGCPYVVVLRRTNRPFLQGLVKVIDAIVSVQPDLPVAPRSLRSAREASSPTGRTSPQADLETALSDEASEGPSTELGDSSDADPGDLPSVAEVVSNRAPPAAAAGGETMWAGLLRRLCLAR